MCKRLLSIIISFCLILSMFPVSAFADSVGKACPNCGADMKCTFYTIGTNSAEIDADDVGVRLTTDMSTYYYKYKCFSCGHVEKGARVLGMGFDESVPGKEVQVEEKPASDTALPPSGYVSTGKPAVNADGKINYAANFYRVWSYSEQGTPVWRTDYYSEGGIHSTDTVGSIIQANYLYVFYEVVAPCDGIYTTYNQTYGGTSIYDKKWIALEEQKATLTKNLKEGEHYYLGLYLQGYGYTQYATKWHVNPTLDFDVEVMGASNVTYNNNVVINNQKYTGNIYTDNTNNLTYIYQDGNDTPVIYDNNTNQYITYDGDTNNYYYITYETAPAPTATPAPTNSPIATPAPGTGGGDSTDIITFLTAAFAELNTTINAGFTTVGVFFTDLTTNLQAMFNGLAVGIAAGFADLKASFTLAIDNLNFTIQNYFGGGGSTPTPTPTPSISPEPSATPVPDAPIIIDKQPEDVSIKTGTTVKYAVEAHSTTGSDLSYFWEWSADDGVSWRGITQKTAAITTATNLTMNGRLFRCTVSDADGNSVVSTSALLQVWEIEPSPSPEPTATPAPSAAPTPTPSGGGEPGSSPSFTNPFSRILEVFGGVLFELLGLILALLQFIIWLVSKMFGFFPFLPPGAAIAIGSTLIICFILAVIKFIRG